MEIENVKVKINKLRKEDSREMRTCGREERGGKKGEKKDMKSLRQINGSKKESKERKE
jgi:hypothetical protein